MNSTINWIASLRGLLVFLVFFSHLSLPLPKDLLFVIGRIGVAGFFLISGYLAKSSIERRNSVQFLWNRFLRLYPIYWLLLIMTFFIFAKYDWKEFLWNVTMFEEFVGYEAMIGAAWMLPIMVLFFILLAFLEYVLKGKHLYSIFYWICIGSLLVGVVRYMTGKPFPTALCLLQSVGLLGYMHKSLESKWSRKYVRCILVFEITLIIASFLSYGNKVLFYFIAYNIGFIAFYLFEKYDISIRLWDELGKLGFTFFLGAAIPMGLISKIIPSVSSMDVILYSAVQLILAIAFSYVVTTYCEKPLLNWGKNLERKMIR
jgi:peptidoglycan/LPS O-acetylase OafA/YrhL